MFSRLGDISYSINEREQFIYFEYRRGNFHNFDNNDNVNDAGDNDLDNDLDYNEVDSMFMIIKSYATNATLRLRNHCE